MGSTEHLISYSANYVPILAFIVVAFLFGAGSLLVSHFVQPKLPDPEKLSVYECGSEPFSDARMPFPVRYYIIAMLFVPMYRRLLPLLNQRRNIRERGSQSFRTTRWRR